VIENVEIFLSSLQEKKNIATGLLQRMNSNRRRFTIFQRFPRQLQTPLAVFDVVHAQVYFYY
jgi:hypothetical protein